MAPANTSAEYSPRLSPAVTLQLATASAPSGPDARSISTAASPARYKAGCENSVLSSLSFGPEEGGGPSPIDAMKQKLPGPSKTYYIAISFNFFQRA